MLWACRYLIDFWRYIVLLLSRALVHSQELKEAKLPDCQVELLLSNLQVKNLSSRDEREVAGYADVMEIVSISWDDITFTENQIKQLGVVFETTTPFDTRRLMSELVVWVQEESNVGNLHLLLIIAIWAVGFFGDSSISRWQ